MMASINSWDTCMVAAMNLRHRVKRRTSTNRHRTNLNIYGLGNQAKFKTVLGQEGVEQSERPRPNLMFAEVPLRKAEAFRLSPKLIRVISIMAPSFRFFTTLNDEGNRIHRRLAYL